MSCYRQPDWTDIEIILPSYLIKRLYRLVYEFFGGKILTGTDVKDVNCLNQVEHVSMYSLHILWV